MHNKFKCISGKKKLLIFRLIFHKLSSYRLDLQKFSIVSGNGLALNWRQTITQINDDTAHW